MTQQSIKLWATFLAWLTNGEISEEESEKKLNEMMEVKRTERGWAGHFICSYDCLYHRNTLLEYGDKKVVVSTVGRYRPNKNSRDFEPIGLDRYFETMAFMACEFEQGYIDADVTQEVRFDSNWRLPQPDMENEADEMHEAVVAEITKDLINDTLRIERYE